MNRRGENGLTPERNKRFFEQSGYWYYSTREGIDIGPFDSYGEAQVGASQFIDFITHAEPHVVRALQQYGKTKVAA